MMLTREEFNKKVRTGRYETPADHRPARPLKRGFRAWWRFFASGLCSTIAYGVKHIHHGTFNFTVLSELAYKMTLATERTGATVLFEGFDSLAPLRGKPFVAVANHISLIETMVLPAGIFAFNDMTVVAKRGLSKYPYFGEILKSCRSILLDQKNARQDLEETLSQGEVLLRDGISILLFPQGRRTAVFNPRKFNSLGAKLARRAGVPLVPIAVKTDFAIPGKLIKDLGPVDPSRPIKFAAGAPLSPDMTQREMQEACTAHIVSKLKEWGMGVEE